MRCTQEFSGRQIEEIFTNVSWAGRQMRYLQKLLRFLRRTVRKSFSGRQMDVDRLD
jgi:hypothetical protein